MSITAEETIWSPVVYHGRQDEEYTQKVGDVSLVELTALVQRRAQEDGEWLIANDLVGENADTMRKMMAWVSRETNIQQCVGAVIREGLEDVRTVDWICRDLANATRNIMGTHG